VGASLEASDWPVGEIAHESKEEVPIEPTERRRRRRRRISS